MKPEETKGTARQNDNTLIKALTFTVDKTMELTKSNSVLGEPVTVGDMTVIPISKLSLGFAGGGADIMNAGKRKKQNPAGAGAGVTMTPMSFLVIQGEDMRVISVEAPPKPSALTGVIDTVVSMAKDARGKKEQSQTVETPAEEQE